MRLPAVPSSNDAMIGHRADTGVWRWMPGVALAAYSLVVLLLCVEEQWRPEWDSAIYMLAARSLAEGNGYSYLGRPFFLRPPGFSYALSFLVDDGRFDFAQLNFLMMVAAVAAVAIVYLALRQTEGPRRSLAATLLMATSPLFVARFNWIQSDLPFLALLFAALALFNTAARSARLALPACLGGSLLLTAALYLRSAGVVLLPGVVLFLLLWPRGRRRFIALAPLLIVPLLYAPWLLHARSAAAVAPKPSEQLLLFDYATATFRVDPGDPASEMLSSAQLWQRVRTNSARLVGDLGAYILATRHGWAVAVVAALLILGLVAALRRGPTLLEWHALTYTLLLLTYFDYDARLLLPLLPAVYAYLVGGLDRIGAHLPLGSSTPLAAWLRTGLAAIVFGGLILINFAALPQALDPRANRLSVGTIGDSWDDYRRAADWLRQNTPEDAAIMTEMAPIVSLLSDRRVYTNRFPREPDMIRRYEIDYVVSFWWSNRDFVRTAAAAAEQKWITPSHAADWPIRIYKVDGR